VRAYVGVTDGEWYRFLAARPSLDEVNFWRPGGSREFRVLAPGEPFFFKSHRPSDRVIGGGFFSGFAALRVSEAWALFDEANGVASLQQMRARVGHYRKQPLADDEDPAIGCVFVRDVHFLAGNDFAAPPPDFAPSIVQGKSYDLADRATAGYFLDLSRRLWSAEATGVWRLPGPVYGDPGLSTRRLGQRAFQAVVLNAYGGRCAVTGDRIRPVLQAAHIRPLPSGGEHRLDNGLLLRSDVHTLYDRGYLGVDAKHRLLVSPRLRKEFGNGEEFYARAGQAIAVPTRPIDRPGSQFVEWHLDEVFKAS
jgi:putative restriction endonuclease